MATANVSTTSPGITPFIVDVTVCNLLPDLSVKDFQVFVDGTLSCTGAGCSAWAKTTATQLTYSGSIIANGTSVQIRRKTPNAVVQLVSFAERFSSGLWNSELDRLVRWREEADLNGVGSGSITATALPVNDAYPTGWDGDVISPPTRNATYDALQLFALLASPNFTGIPTVPTAADNTSTTQAASTAYAKIRVDNALSSSPALGGNPTATTQTLGNNSTRVATTQFVQTEKTDLLTNNLPVGFKNKVVNGDFFVNQRTGTFAITASGSVQSVVTMDRWAFSSIPDGGTTPAITISQETFTLGQTTVPDNPTRYFSANCTTTPVGIGTAGYTILTQNIEDVTLLSGKTVTISFWAKSSIASKRLGIEMAQTFGSGGSPSSSVTGIGGATFAVTSSWVKYSFTVSVPSISGKTLGTDTNTNYTAINIWLEARSSFSSRLGGGTLPLLSGTGTVDIADVQIEEGSTATKFDRLTFDQQLWRCRRYYQKSYQYQTAPNTVTLAGIVQLFIGDPTTANISVTTRLAPPMRTVPSLTVYDGEGNANAIFKGGANKVAFASTVSSESITVGSNDATSAADFRYHYVVDANL